MASDSVDGRRNTDGSTSEGEMKQCGPCQLSGRVKDADIFCRQCDDYMCESCATIHNRLKFSRNHTSVNVVSFKCDPCSQAALVKEADKFCQQCDEHMCESCATIHNRLKVSINHTVVSASRQVLPASTRTSFADLTVASCVDINVPAGCIYGSTITPDGRIVLAYFAQMQIIILDSKLTIQSSLKLQGNPWDVAADGDDDVIVSMGRSKRLQWIHVDVALRAGRTITTSHPCYGVAVHNGHIYISVTPAENPSTGHVQVLNRDGGVVRRIGAASGADRFTDPSYITVGAPGTVYVADNTDVGRITCFTSAGDRVYDVRHNGMRYTRGMVADHDGNLLVCCGDSNDVHLLAKDGSHTRILLTSADGVRYPLSMAYRRSDGTLIVTMRVKPYCRAYKLKYGPYDICTV